MTCVLHGHMQSHISCLSVVVVSFSDSRHGAPALPFGRSMVGRHSRMQLLCTVPPPKQRPYSTPVSAPKACGGTRRRLAGAWCRASGHASRPRAGRRCCWRAAALRRTRAGMPRAACWCPRTACRARTRRCWLGAAACCCGARGMAHRCPAPALPHTNTAENPACQCCAREIGLCAGGCAGPCAAVQWQVSAKQVAQAAGERGAQVFAPLAGVARTTLTALLVGGLGERGASAQVLDRSHPSRSCPPPTQLAHHPLDESERARRGTHDHGTPPCLTT